MRGDEILIDAGDYGRGHSHTRLWRPWRPGVGGRREIRAPTWSRDGGKGGSWPRRLRAAPRSSWPAAASDRADRVCVPPSNGAVARRSRSTARRTKISVKPDKRQASRCFAVRLPPALVFGLPCFPPSPTCWIFGLDCTHLCRRCLLRLTMMFLGELHQAAVFFHDAARVHEMHPPALAYPFPESWVWIGPGPLVEFMPLALASVVVWNNVFAVGTIAKIHRHLECSRRLDADLSSRLWCVVQSKTRICNT